MDDSMPWLHTYYREYGEITWMVWVASDTKCTFTALTQYNIVQLGPTLCYLPQKGRPAPHGSGLHIILTSEREHMIMLHRSRT